MVNEPMDAVREPARTAVTPSRTLRSWRGAAGLSGVAAGLSGVAAGAIMITGAFLPWLTTFAGLIGIPGVRGSYGRILAATGAVIALAGLFHLLRGDRWSRWLIGMAGFLATGFSGYLLLQLAASLRSLSTDSMIAGRAGPGLWVTAAGAALAFATMFLPAPAQQAADGQDPLSLRAWAADRESTGLRRGIQLALGVIWLADGLLQLQPFMFGRGFVNQILMPAYMGSPAGVTGPAMAFTRLVLHAPAAWDTAFAVTQILLGAAMLWRPTVRAALAASIAWALGVWWFGEGLGGVLSGSASPVTGAPGAVILYALIAVLAWPRRAGTGDDPRTAGSVAAGSPLGPTGARAAWLVLWGSFAFFILQAPNRAPHALQQTVAGLASGEPGWIAALDRALASAAGGHGLGISIGLAVVFVIVGSGVFWSSTTRAALALSVVLALAIWAFGENFGALATGQGTDPNSGPLLVLLAAAFWPLARPRQIGGAAPAGMPPPGA